MEREEPINSEQTNLIYRFPSQRIQNRIKTFFGLPKSLHGNYVDNEQCSWRMLIVIKKTKETFVFF